MLNNFIKILKISTILSFSILIFQYFYFISNNFLKLKIKDKTIYNFLSLILKYITYLIIFLIFLETLNIKTSSLITIIGTLGITIGLSLKNSISNMSSGILIILLELFKVDDIIEIEKEKGKVISIKIFTTIIKLNNGDTVTIPNSKFLSNRIINFSKNDIKLLNIYLILNKDKNFIKNKKLINKILSKFKNKKYIKNFFIYINNVNLNSIEIVIKIYTKNEDLDFIKTEIYLLILKSIKLIN